jgi:hypothetical protein
MAVCQRCFHALLTVSIGVASDFRGVTHSTASADCVSAFGFTVGDSQQCGSGFGGVAIALGNVATAFAGVGPSSIGNFGTVAFAGAGNNNATSGGGSTWRRRPVLVAKTPAT